MSLYDDVKAEVVGNVGRTVVVMTAEKDHYVITAANVEIFEDGMPLEFKDDWKIVPSIYSGKQFFNPVLTPYQEK